MSPARSIATVGLLVALGAVPGILAEPVTAQIKMNPSGPMVVTTDTPEYCLHLLERVSGLLRLATLPVPREVGDLTTEGQKMCEHGQTRMGIMRLRSALMIMEKSNGPAYR